MKLYVSGPMTGCVDLNYPAFFAAEGLLHLFSFDVSNPAQYAPQDGWQWENYLRRDLVDLLDCGGVATLTGWGRSRGARFEVRTARTLNMPVHPVAWWTSHWKEFA